MASSTLISVLFALITIALVGAWAGGYLDRYQKIAQDHALDAMGENRASYGLKSMLTCYLIFSKLSSHRCLEGTAA